MFEKFICPECKGSGEFISLYDDEEVQYCDFCWGTGYATDEDLEDPMFSYEKDS